eukprot:GGOE01028238.1.p1 GENE.GGOE01028238.1~~GGOE01028238.1.p1  ORF type:complete len:153 (-),score=0.24 GGOE01028238.1:253-711(-)
MGGRFPVLQTSGHSLHPHSPAAGLLSSPIPPIPWLSPQLCRALLYSTLPTKQGRGWSIGQTPLLRSLDCTFLPFAPVLATDRLAPRARLGRSSRPSPCSRPCPAFASCVRHDAICLPPGSDVSALSCARWDAAGHHCVEVLDAALGASNSPP